MRKFIGLDNTKIPEVRVDNIENKVDEIEKELDIISPGSTEELLEAVFDEVTAVGNQVEPEEPAQAIFDPTNKQFSFDIPKGDSGINGLDGKSIVDVTVSPEGNLMVTIN